VNAISKARVWSICCAPSNLYDSSFGGYVDNISGIPYSIAEFDQDGKPVRTPLVPSEAREIIIVSHGWNNSRSEAESMYKTLFENFAAVHGEGTEGLAIVGVIWPSKKFDFSDEVPLDETGQVRAAGVDGWAGGTENVEKQFSQFEALFEDSPNKQELPKLHALLGKLDQPASQDEFVQGLRRLVGTPNDCSDLDASSFFFQVDDPRDVFVNALQASAEVGIDAPDGDGAARAAGIGDVFSGVGNAVGSLLNITTYYEMKKRAGTVGATGLALLIDELSRRDAVQRLHLVGHSFGARLVTAAAMHSQTKKLHGMFLLQGAFSHSGFSDVGYFRNVIVQHRLAGPIVITHTVNDRAVGKSYAIASRISRDAASGLGDENDKYGGLGRNGARNMQSGEVSEQCTELLDSGTPYAFEKQQIHNLESSNFIHDHGDVEGRQVAWAISQGIALA
jgi:hypothetical protein